MKVQPSHLRAALLATAGLALAAPAVADVGSSATYLNGNLDATKFGGSETHTSTVAQSLLTTEIGFATANAHSAPGALAGSATISMDATRYGGAALEAKAQARTKEMLHFGTDYCLNEVCRSAASLGVTALNIEFAVHASGGTSAFATDPRFDHATASIAYNYALTNGVGFTASGGGSRERHETGEAVGDIHSMTASLAVRVGKGEVRLQGRWSPAPAPWQLQATVQQLSPAALHTQLAPDLLNGQATAQQGPGQGVDDGVAHAGCSFRQGNGPRRWRQFAQAL